MDSLRKSLWGVVLIVIGIILGLNALEFTDINIFFDGWWTLFIIVPSLIGVFEQKEKKTGNVIGLVIGVALLLSAQGFLSFELILKLAFPLVLVIIGISFLFGDSVKGIVSNKIKNSNTGDLENIVATFSEQKINKNAEKFKGAVLDAIFGGITLDLRGAEIEKEVVIKASSIFGGIDILVPSDVNVKVSATPIFGGVTNKISNYKENKKTIYIEGFCLFGGIDIK